MNNDNRRQAERNQARLDCRGAKEEAKGKMELRYSEDEVNWEELAGIGILKDELEQAGELMTLLSGDKTGVISLSLVLLGANVELDATLQLVREKGEVLIEIVGIEPADNDTNI